MSQFCPFTNLARLSFISIAGINNKINMIWLSEECCETHFLLATSSGSFLCAQLSSQDWEGYHALTRGLAAETLTPLLSLFSDCESNFSVLGWHPHHFADPVLAPGAAS